MTDAPDPPDAPDVSVPEEARLPGPVDGGEGDGDVSAVPTFDAPWQARAFAIAVALADDEDRYDWTAFQSRLIEEVGGVTEAEDAAVPGADASTTDGAPDGDDPGAVEARYYRAWLTVLERLLDERGLVDREAVADRAAEFAAGDRDASEFVADDR